MNKGNNLRNDMKERGERKKERERERERGRKKIDDKEKIFKDSMVTCCYILLFTLFLFLSSFFSFHSI